MDELTTEQWSKIWALVHVSTDRLQEKVDKQRTSTDENVKNWVKRMDESLKEYHEILPILLKKQSAKH